MRQLTTDAKPDWSPSWSPDGTEVVFYSLRTGKRHIWAMPSAGGQARQLTSSKAEDYHPRWSPNGGSISFHSLRTGNMDIWVLPAEGGEPRQITDHQRGDFSAQWSRDGESLLWISTRDSGVPKRWRVTVAGGVPQQVTKGPAWYPAPSRDGERVYFTGYAERTGNI